MSESKERAFSTLTHYLRQVYEKAGLRWTQDNNVEVYGIVEDIVQAAIEDER